MRVVVLFMNFKHYLHIQILNSVSASFFFKMSTLTKTNSIGLLLSTSNNSGDDGGKDLIFKYLELHYFIQRTLQINPMDTNAHKLLQK